jgi:hypothetical protein
MYAMIAVVKGTPVTESTDATAFEHGQDILHCFFHYWRG